MEYVIYYRAENEVIYPISTEFAHSSICTADSVFLVPPDIFSSCDEYFELDQ